MRLKVNILFVFILGAQFLLLGQNYAEQTQQVQSSKKILKKKVGEPSLTEQITYAKKVFRDSTSKAIDLVENVLFEAVKRKKKYEEALAYQTLGYFNHDLKSYDLAVYNFNKAIPLLSKKSNDLNKTYIACARSAFLDKNYSEAAKKYELSNKILLNQRKTSQLINNKLALGDVYLAQNEYSKAKESFQYCLSVSKKSITDEQKIKANIGLGKVNKAQKNYNTAKIYYTKANELAEKVNNDDLANRSFDLLAEVELQRNNPSDNMYYQQQAYEYNTVRGNYNSAVSNSSSIANTYLQQNRPQEALEVLESSTELVKQTSDVKVKKEFYKTLSNLYEKQGKSKEAEKVNEKYEELEDSLMTVDQERELALQTKNELLSNAQNRVLLLEKDREINQKEILLLRQEQALQESTIKRQTIITYSLAIGLLIILVLSFFIYKNNREKQISNQLLVLKSLRNQMNPHFIFNSLNSVNSYIAKQDERSANKYLSEFSKLMREVLEYSQEDFIPLSKEIEILGLYMNLEHYRFKNDFDFTFEVDKNINLDDYQIPPMLLQPFVENAIWHGLRYKNEKGRLEVSFAQKQNYVEVIIRDDGIGRQQSKLVKTQNQKKMKSTGLKNVQNRLDIIKNVFKRNLEIDIEDLNPITKEGTQVIVKLYS